MALWGQTDTFADVPKYLQPAVTFDGTSTSVVNTTDDTITIPSHSFENDDQVVYTSTSDIGGLTSGTTYFVVGRTADTIQLAATAGGAAITLTTVGGATDDSLQQTVFNITAADNEAEPPAYFIDVEEAGISTNTDKGLRTGGWNQLRTWTTNGGTVTRYAAEPIVAMGVPASVSGDAEDVVTPEATFAFLAQPATTLTVADGEDASFTVTTQTNSDSATVSYTWEYDPAGGTAWVDVDAITDIEETAGGLGVLESTISFPAPLALNGATFRVTASASFPGGDSITTAPSTTSTLTVTA